jgi:hypothetical protein
MEILKLYKVTKYSDIRPIYVYDISSVSIADKRNFRFDEAKFSVLYHVGIKSETVAFLRKLRFIFYVVNDSSNESLGE